MQSGCTRARTIGGGARSAELILRGFVRAICSAVRPLAVRSCCEQFPLAQFTACAVFTPLQDFCKASDKHVMDVMNAALGGMQIARSSFARTAHRIAGASTRPPDRPPGQPPDSVDLSTEMVALLAARNQFQANARVLQASDQMQKQLLDILA
jgi:hypothetical protein